MSGKIVAIVQVACGFARAPENEWDTLALSQVDFDRSQVVIEGYRNLTAKEKHPKVLLWTTGQVAWGPYVEMPEMTLAALNAKRLNVAFPYATVSQVPGLNAFSESYNALLMAKASGVEKLYVVVSSFYLTAYRRMWEAAAKRRGIEIRMIAVEHQKGVVASEVVDFYKSAQPQILSRIAASSDQEGGLPGYHRLPHRRPH
jgi:hypothetical protein